MGNCQCCKKRERDDEAIIRQSPLICEDIERPNGGKSENPNRISELSSAVLNNDKSSIKSTEKNHFRNNNEVDDSVGKGSHQYDQCNLRKFEVEPPSRNREKSKPSQVKSSTENDKEAVTIVGSSLLVSTEITMKETHSVFERQTSEKPSDESIDKTRETETSSRKPDITIDTEENPANSPQQSPSSPKSAGIAECIKGNEFFEKPLDCSDKTLVNLSLRKGRPRESRFCKLSRGEDGRGHGFV